ncbi:MAG: putative bifunctional diguanylate cyclase/phosphodiesterase, partial [Magnetospirillum sp.]
VERAVLHVNRIGGSVALLMMGLDRFTLVNDALGHAAGDHLLTEVARRLRQCIRETDTAVRLDGDKFALVMTIASVNDSVIVAEKVLAAVKEPFAIDGQEVVVTFSIGIALYPQDAGESAALIKQAENALHHAKVSGRNNYQFFSKDMNNKAKSRLDLEARMRRALANEEFVVFYQPKVSAENNRIVGAESLIRWIDPDRGMVNPGEFIPVAEETGLIEQIGTWVLRRSCQQIREWQDQGLSTVKVSVNVSARQFKSRALLDIVTGVLAETSLDPKWLELEITESMLMNDVEAAVRKMTALRDLGLGLSIDDFGTGYSSLSYLGRFPITTLKIDRAFIADVDRNPKTAEIARAIIGLSRGLNLEVVAEGCEIEAHIQFLKDNGCDTVQGFYYSRPVPADQFRAMLADGYLRGQS